MTDSCGILKEGHGWPVTEAWYLLNKPKRWCTNTAMPCIGSRKGAGETEGERRAHCGVGAFGD